MYDQIFCCPTDNKTTKNTIFYNRTTHKENGKNVNDGLTKGNEIINKTSQCRCYGPAHSALLVGGRTGLEIKQATKHSPFHKDKAKIK